MSGNLLGVRVPRFFYHVKDECPKNIGSDVATNLKNPSQAHRGCLVGPMIGFKPVKQVDILVSKKNNANTSGNKLKDVESRKEVSNPNLFDVLNSVENDVDLGTNGGTSNLASKEANASGSSLWNVGSSSTSATPIGKPLENIDYSGDHDSEDEVEPVDNEMAGFLALKRVDFGQEIPDNIQSVCHNLDIKGQTRVSWKNKKQSTLSISSVEADYRRMACATCEII
ncbi:hypothetical protein Tco_1319728 [Tanacetum coccineum]